MMCGCPTPVGSTNKLSRADVTVTPLAVPRLYLCGVAERSHGCSASAAAGGSRRQRTGLCYHHGRLRQPGELGDAQQVATDAVFESIMPLYCGLPKVGCVTDSVQWNIITYEANGSPSTSGCAARRVPGSFVCGCRNRTTHYCQSTSQSVG